MSRKMLRYKPIGLNVCMGFLFHYELISGNSYFVPVYYNDGYKKAFKTQGIYDDPKLGICYQLLLSTKDYGYLQVPEMMVRRFLIKAAKNDFLYDIWKVLFNKVIDTFNFYPDIKFVDV